MSKTLEKLNCQMFRCRLTFDEKNFNTQRFRKIANLDPKLPITVITIANSGRKGRQEHGHIDLNVDGVDSSLTLLFHPTPLEGLNDEDQGHSIEERISELAKVFKSKSLDAVTMSRFVFDDSYLPTIFLGYPVSVTSSNNPLKGAFVSGTEFTISKPSSHRKIFVQQEDNETTIVISSSRKIVLSSFRVENLVSKDYVLAGNLVKKVDYVDA